MQTVFNFMALTSFIISAATVGGGVWLYKHKDVMIEDARKKATEEIVKSIPGIVEKLMPEIPEIPVVTGGAIPGNVPNITGGAIPF